MTVRVSSLAGVVLAALLPVLSACSVNPATGKQSFTAFMSRAEEMEIGRKEHPKILEEYGGAYNDRALAAYVRGIGLGLAGVSETPKFPYTFTILNEEKVNAFALPGGYVYITRGLLALAGNEAEMAGVLAHEIGHVVARHTAERYSRAVATNLGLTLLGALGSAAGVPSGVGRLASFGARAALQGYSREQELEADMLAVRYLARSGYDPRTMTGFLRKMQAHQKFVKSLEGKDGKGESFDIMSTHPRTSKRIERAIALARVSPVRTPRVERDAYLDRIDGLIFGDDPAQGIRRGRTFSHPVLRFQFQVPAGFVLSNGPRRVLAKGPGGAVIVFDMASKESAEKAGDLRDYLQGRWGRNLSLEGVERIEVNAMEGATARGRTGSGKDVRLVAVRESREKIYRFLFLTPPELTAGLARELQRTTYSLRKLSRGEAAAIKPLRVRIVKVKPGDSPAILAGDLPRAETALGWFRILNGLARGERLPVGGLVKVIGE